jgi:death on curing protein
MTQYIWPEEAAILALHEEMITEFGGKHGTCDRNLLETEIKRPINMTLFEEPDIAALAAAYGSGFARHPPFKEGSARSAFLVMVLFLSLNGYELTASDRDAAKTVAGVVTGEVEEIPLAAWLRANIRLVGERRAVSLARKAMPKSRTAVAKTAAGKGLKKNIKTVAKTAKKK